MQELIEKLQTQHNLSADQSHGILSTIKNYIQEKFPMLGGAVDSMFANTSSTATGNSMSTGNDTIAGSNTAPIETAEHHKSFLDKISDVIPGTAGEKIEDFTKKAADKVGGFFEGNKKDY